MESLPLAALIAAALAAPWAAAQAPDDGSLEHAAQAVASANTRFGCELELIGSLRTDPLLGRLFIAYSATGADCGAASEALAAQGAELGVQFLRRPSLAQLRALVGTMIRSVETTTGCRITLRGTPVLNEETSRWFVTYLTSGSNCEDVVYALRDQGDALDISFVGGPARD